MKELAIVFLFLSMVCSFSWAWVRNDKQEKYWLRIGWGLSVIFIILNGLSQS